MVIVLSNRDCLVYRWLYCGSNINMIKKFEINNQGSIFLFTPLTEDAKLWWEENVSNDCQKFGNAFVVEHRYAYDIIYGLNNED